MEARLGDVIDDFCVKCRRLTNHSVVSLLNGAAAKVKVVLGGQGGDEIFGGYARYLVAYLEQALKGAIFETAARHAAGLQREPSLSASAGTRDGDEPVGG